MRSTRYSGRYVVWDLSSREPSLPTRFEVGVFDRDQAIFEGEDVAPANFHPRPVVCIRACHHPFGYASISADRMGGIRPFCVRVTGEDVGECLAYCILTFDGRIAGGYEDGVRRHCCHDRVEIVAVESVGVGGEEFNGGHSDNLCVCSDVDLLECFTQKAEAFERAFGTVPVLDGEHPGIAIFG